MPDPDLVELTRRSMQLTNEHDFDAATAMFAEDAVFDVSEAGVGRFEGREAVRAYLEDWVGSFERQEFMSWDGIELGGGVVFVVAVLEALPAGSGASVQERWAFTVVWRDGAISAVTASQDVEGARAAAEGVARQAALPGSKDPVETVRESLRIWRRTGEPSWELCHEEIEVYDHDIMDASEYRGQAGVEQWLTDWAAPWKDFSMHAEEFIDAGDGVVVVFVRMKVTGRGSDISIEREDAIVYRVRDGLLARIDYFNDRSQALAAAGLAAG